MDELIEILAHLTDCRLRVSEWLEWWDKNQSELETVLPHADYMRIKPRFRDDPIVYRILEGSQSGAEKYLKKMDIPFVHSDYYVEKAKADWNKHLKAREREAKAAEIRNRQKREQIIHDLPDKKLSAINLNNDSDFFFAELSSLAEVYRKLGATIEYERGKPVTSKEIMMFEEEIDCILPDALKDFLRCYGTLHFSAALPKDWIERELKPIIPNCNYYAEFDISLDEMRTAERNRKITPYAADIIPAIGLMNVPNGDTISIHRKTGEIIYLNHDGDDFDGYILSNNFEEYLCNLVYIGGVGKEFWELEAFTPYPQTGGIDPCCENARLYRYLIGWLR